VLVAVEPDEAVVVLHLDLLGKLAFQVVETVIEAVAKNVAHGDELDVGTGPQRLNRGAGATVAAADHADLDRVGPGCMDARG
jgi:hypothetical protein